MSNLDATPRLGAKLGSSRRSRILLVCFYDPNGIITVRENIATLQRYSRFDFEVLNLWPGRGGYLTMPSSVDLGQFFGVMIHPTACYNPDNLNSLDSALKTKFRDYDGIKILAKQDEHYRSAAFPEFVKRSRFNVLMTCIPADQLSRVYDEDLLSNLTVVHTLTGFVSESLHNIETPAYEDRPLDIVYRGSLQPLSFGRLGFEKRSIGFDVAVHPAVRNLKIDISSRWEDRLVGNDWFTFLGNSRAVLGVESGSNLFDFDGSVSRRCRAFESEHADMDAFSQDVYLLAEREILKAHEDNVHYAQISPRHFEAAATRSLQIMFEGAYSGIFEPHRHFFPLKRDLSNIEEAVALLNDPSRAKAMIDAAYKEIIFNDAYTYESFVCELDAAIEKTHARTTARPHAPVPKALTERGHAASSAEAMAIAAAKQTKPRVLVLCAHDPVVDPRIEWWASTLNKDYSVCELGAYRFSEIGEGPRVKQVGPDWWRVQVERTLHQSVWKFGGVDTMLTSPGVREMAFLQTIVNASRRELVNGIGAFDMDETDHDRFRSLCTYFLNTNSALMQAAFNLGRFDVVLCADLESLPAAVALRTAWNCYTIFDSHEYWPYSYTEFRAWENEFWGRLEGRLAAEVDQCVTVSETLAAHLSEAYDQPFMNVPNAARLADAEVDGVATDPAPSDATVFLFQGNFAAGRGLEMLVDAWADVKPGAVLHLRGPKNPHHQEIIEIARRNGTLDRTVFFKPAVTEAALIAHARTADVGIIPYDSRHYGNRFACPNKMSQYMAAGLPILTNSIEYVSNIVDGNKLGESVPFHERDRLIAAIDRWAAQADARRDAGSNARRYFDETFHWERLSHPLVQRINDAVAKIVPSTEPLRFDWIENDETMQMKRTSVPEQISKVVDKALDFSPSDRMVLARLIWRRLPQRFRYQLAARLRNGKSFPWMR